MSNLNIPIAIGIGGFVGALMRFYISDAVVRVSGDDYRFFGTLTVNLIGCFAIGVLMTIATNTTRISPVMQKCLVTGLLGSLTTFSTFAFESLNLIQDGRYGAAMMKISISLVVGLLLVWVGMLTAGAFVSSET
jgi:CrcB protein